ncbi:MAG TPA: SDR family NAD(P)-dependent oxidoreductase, partial [Chloroflexota bacterium]
MSERFPISGPIDLRGQVAIVTGAARGIGRAIALALAREGAIVVVADVLPAEETVSEIHRRGGQAFAQNVDVTRDADVVALVEATVARYGRIDVLVNNAG